MRIESVPKMIKEIDTNLAEDSIQRYLKDGVIDKKEAERLRAPPLKERTKAVYRITGELAFKELTENQITEYASKGLIDKREADKIRKLSFDERRGLVDKLSDILGLVKKRLLSKEEAAKIWRLSPEERDKRIDALADEGQ